MTFYFVWCIFADEFKNRIMKINSMDIDVTDLLVGRVVSLALAINKDERPHFVEVYIDYHSLEVMYYGEGFNGDEVDVMVVGLKRDDFGEKIDELINFLKHENIPNQI